MKSPFVFSAVMLASSAWFTLASAQDSAVPSSTNAPPSVSVSTDAVPPPSDQASPPAAAAATATGKSNYLAPSGKIPGDQKGFIEKIDAAAGTLVVEGKTFKLSPKAKVYVDNERKTLADLKEGDKVAVTFRENPDGSLRATMVVKGTRHRAKAKDEAAEEKTEKTN